MIGIDDYFFNKLDGFVVELGFIVYMDGLKSMVDVFFICVVLMVGIVGLFYVIICFFIVFKVLDVCVFVGWVLVFIVFLYIIVFVVVVFVCVNMIDIINGLDM